MKIKEMRGFFSLLGVLGALCVDWVEGWRLWSGLRPSGGSVCGLVRDRALNAWGRAVSDR